MIKKILPVFLVLMSNTAYADPSFLPRDQGGYDGIINNAILYITFCDDDGKECVESRAEAWGQVCDKSIADEAAKERTIYDYIDPNKIYYSWRCEMLGDTTIPLTEQSGMSSEALHNRDHPKSNYWTYYSKFISFISGEK